MQLRMSTTDKRILSELEWKALRANFLPTEGVPYLKELGERMPYTSREDYVFALAGKNKYGERYYAAFALEDPLAWGSSSVPALLALYANPELCGALPTFESLYNEGLQKLRRSTWYVAIACSLPVWFFVAVVTSMVLLIQFSPNPATLSAGDLVPNLVISTLVGVASMLLCVPSFYWFFVRGIPKPA